MDIGGIREALHKQSFEPFVVLSGGTHREDLARYAYRPDIVVDSIADLCGMDPAIIGGPSALSELSS